MVKPSDAGECQSLSISSRCCKLSPRISILATRPVECLVFLRLQQLCRLREAFIKKNHFLIDIRQ